MPLIPFVDRKPELALFHRMLAGETDKRILRILVEAEWGKTRFLLQLLQECEQQSSPVPVVLLNFDQRCSGLTDFLSVVRAVRRQLGDDCTPAICAYEDDIYRRAPLVSIHTGEGGAGVDWGRRGRFTEADISDVAGRDRIQVGPVSEAAPTADLIAWQKAQMGRALCRDLAGLVASHHRVVLLVDTFDHISEDTRIWLERWLFEPLCRELLRVLLVVAGRPEECQPFFEQLRPWSSLVAPIDRFTPFNSDDVQDYCYRRGLLVSEEEMPLILDLTRASGPAEMARIGDLLMQERGGAP